MFNTEKYSGQTFSSRFLTGPVQNVTVPTTFVTTLLPARPNRVGFFILDATTNTFFSFGDSQVTAAPYTGHQGIWSNAVINSVWTLDEHGPIIQQAIYARAINSAGSPVFYEWWDQGFDASELKRPPLAGVRMLNDKGLLKDWCYNGARASEINQMAKAIDSIRGKIPFGPIKQ